MPNIRWLLALVTRLQRFLYLKTNGRVGGSMFGVKILLLTNVGRRTGHRRITPLLYVQDGDEFVVVASNAGDDRHPAWWLNLAANPHARVQVGGDHHDVVARQASTEEEARLWPVLDAAYPAYARYREGTDRQIPVVILEHVPADA